jgi:hypothetical protein
MQQMDCLCLLADHQTLVFNAGSSFFARACALTAVEPPLERGLQGCPLSCLCCCCVCSEGPTNMNNWFFCQNHLAGVTAVLQQVANPLLLSARYQFHQID